MQVFMVVMDFTEGRGHHDVPQGGGAHPGDRVGGDGDVAVPVPNLERAERAGRGRAGLLVVAVGDDPLRRPVLQLLLPTLGALQRRLNCALFEFDVDGGRIRY